MQYQISQSGVLADNPNGAHVAVRWTEKYQDGDISYDVTWVLRKQADGWRVAGMAMELIPGGGQEFLNFEDPDDMLRKQNEALAAMNPAAETAALPAGADSSNAGAASFAPQNGSEFGAGAAAPENFNVSPQVAPAGNIER